MTILEHTCAKNDTSKTGRKKWVRKAPLISTGQPNRSGTGAPGQMLMLSRSEKAESMEKLREDLIRFLEKVHLSDWDEQQFKRFYAFGEYMTCAKWEGHFWISSPDIFKVQCALYRIEKGRPVSMKRKFEESILTYLRTVPENEGMRLEGSESPFIDFLYSIGAIRTRKRQKIFRWDAVNHLELFNRKFLNEPKEEPPKALSGKPRAKAKESDYVIKSFRLFERPKMDALLSAIEIVEELADGDDGQRSESNSSLSLPHI